MAGGIAVLAGAGVAIRRPALEQWHLWKLESEDPEEMLAAVQRLGELRSVRAIPRLPDRVRLGDEGCKPPFEPEVLSAFADTLAAAEAAAVPALIRLATDDSRDEEDAAAWALGSFGDRARPAIPALTAALEDGEASVRDAAAISLKTIRGE